VAAEVAGGHHVPGLQHPTAQVGGRRPEDGGRRRAGRLERGQRASDERHRLGLGVHVGRHLRGGRIGDGAPQPGLPPLLGRYRRGHFAAAAGDINLGRVKDILGAGRSGRKVDKKKVNAAAAARRRPPSPSPAAASNAQDECMYPSPRAPPPRPPPSPRAHRRETEGVEERAKGGAPRLARLVPARERVEREEHVAAARVAGRFHDPHC
jgi:hypothetical protein